MFHLIYLHSPAFRHKGFSLVYIDHFGKLTQIHYTLISTVWINRLILQFHNNKKEIINNLVFVPANRLKKKTNIEIKC